jgi:hypothetical protein
VHSLQSFGLGQGDDASEIYFPRSFSVLAYIALRYIFSSTRFRTQCAIGVFRGGANHPGTQLNKLRWKEWTITRSRRTDPQEFWLDLASGLIKPAEPLPSVVACRVDRMPRSRLHRPKVP